MVVILPMTAILSVTGEGSQRSGLTTFTLVPHRSRVVLAKAIVAYFVYSFVLPTLTMLLASGQQWFRDLQPWVDFNFAQGALFNGALTGEQWTQLGVTSVIWLIVPLTLGVWLVLRSEVK